MAMPLTSEAPASPQLDRKTPEPLAAGSDLPHVVIIGGGFGGLNAAKALGEASVRVTLIDKRNFHLFQPLLYQVATAALAPSEIAYPLRAVLRKQRNTTVLMGEVTGIDIERQVVHLGGDRIPYDYLIVAAGSQESYFGHDDWRALAPGLKSVEDALTVRQRVFRAFEMAERETGPERRTELLTFVIVGGGPTGVELAGALAEIAHQTLRKEFRNIDPAGARIILVEGGETLLNGYSKRLTSAARRSLEKLGVEVRTSTRVTDIAPGRVVIGDEEIRAETVLWAAGVTAQPLGRSLNAPLTRSGQVPVTEHLTLPDHPNVYVVGDLAASKDTRGDYLPGVAQVAIQGGTQAGRNIARAVRGEPPEPFRYRDKGMMATIGWNRAVAKIGRIELSGFPAWFIWATIHIAYLIGFRSRFTVMVQWAWAYITRGRGARLITNQATPEQDG
jgi:NADH:ubiquinone reductase (H+-translocating)